MAGLRTVNSVSTAEAKTRLLRCCGSTSWATEMVKRRPFKSRAQLFKAATEAWNGLSEEDWVEAFRHHPRIGDKEALRRKFEGTREWAEGEQAGAAKADDLTLDRLAKGNRLYERQFGYIFIVCATGKSAREMLELLQRRLEHDPRRELRVAAGEQDKITRIRLEKLLQG